MDIRVAGLLLIGVALLCAGAVGGVSAEPQSEQSAPVGVEHGDSVSTAGSQTVDGNGTAPDVAEAGPFTEPGVYEVDVADASVISVEIIGPGGGGGSQSGELVGEAGAAMSGGDGGYIHAEFNVSEFQQIQITVGSGGGGGDSNGGGSGGDGFYDGGSGGYQNPISGWQSSGGGGGGATVIEGVSGIGTVPLAAAGGGGGGAAWDQYVAGSDNSGGGGGAAGGLGGTADGGTVGGGTDGNDAESAGGLVSNDIGGDGGDSTPDTAESGDDGGTWLNDEYLETVEEDTPGGGGAGGSGGPNPGDPGEDGADGAVTLNPKIVVESLTFPDTVTPDESLTVEYTLTNTGEASGTESSVDLLVDGTNSPVDDSDSDVTVGPGELVSGTLSFGAVDTFFAPGEFISFSVGLSDYGDSAGGQTAVESGTAPDLVVESLDYPTAIAPTDDLSVNYTIENVGDEAGTESAVELTVAGTVEDSDQNVAVGAGETATGSLTFTGVEGNYGDGDTVSFAVSLAEFNDSQTGETAVQDIGDGPALVIESVDAPTSTPASGELEVGYTVENVGDETGTESAVELLVDGATEDSDTDVTVGADETASGTLTYAGVGDAFAPGDTIAFTVALTGFGDSASGQTDLLAEGQINLAVEPSSVVVDPGAVQTYEVVVEGTDSGILGYQGVVVDIGDTGVGSITGFEEQFDQSGDGVFSGSEIQNGGQTLYLEAATGASFANPAPAYTIATFDVEAVGAQGATTDLSFDASAPQTVAEFESGQPYSTDVYRGGTLILDAGQGPNLVLTGAQAPAEVEPDESLTVDYTLENFGDETGTESAVTLSVDGTEADSDQGVTLGPGKSTTGTLSFAGVDGYDPGDSIGWTVALSEFGDTESGQTQVPGEANLTVASLTYPDTVDADAELVVEYTVENVGSAEGTESAVELLVGGTTVDSDTDVTVGAGETASGTLTYAGVGDEFAPGDTVAFTVALDEFGDSATGSISVEEADSPEFAVDIVGTNDPVDEGETLEVTVAVENVGTASGTQSVDLSTGGLGSNSTALTLGPGNLEQVVLTVDTEEGDAGEYTAQVTTANSSDSQTVTVEEDTGVPEFVVADVSTNAPVVEGKTLEVTVAVENVGNAAGVQTVTAQAPALGEVSEEFELTPGAVAEQTLTMETEIGDTGEYSLTVGTDDRSMQEPVELYLPALPGQDSPPEDVTGDDKYEDVDGDGQFSIFDVQTFFNAFDSAVVRDHAWAYDFDNSGEVSIFDVQAMFNSL